MITSSPSLIPHHANKTCIPVVQEFTATVVLWPQYAEISFSNCFVLGPVVIHPDFKAATTASVVTSSILGGENGIIIRLFDYSISRTLIF